jgi:hypothetical protein
MLRTLLIILQVLGYIILFTIGLLGSLHLWFYPRKPKKKNEGSTEN